MADYGNQRMTHLPTYRLEPREHERFYPSKVKEIVENIVKHKLEGREYDHLQAKSQAEEIVN